MSHLTTLPLYVVSNGELAREALNAVVGLLGTTSFAMAIKISVLFSILSASVNYIRLKNIIAFAKWFVIYFGITVIMLGPEVNLEIIDSSNPGAVYTVGNVPYGLGYPASLITSVSHGMVSAFEELFHLPDDLTYNKTGMLFGSKLFRLASEINVVNPEIKSQLNEYVKNCVLGDILITKKYSMANLANSGDLMSTITASPSNIRGIYVNGVFKTCLEATGDLKKNLETDIKENGFTLLTKKIFGALSGQNGKTEQNGQNIQNGQSGQSGQKQYNASRSTAGNSRDLQATLQRVYDYFSYDSLSNSALEIVTQNLLINGIREGILNYSSETGATAALLNLSTTQAMERMRMSFATSRNVATYMLPVMHTVLLLLMLSMFPVIVFLAFQPNLTSQVLKNYIYTLLWIESWPLMFACLNLIVTFYAKELGSGGLTISNIDQLLLQHSDIANMAGYLMLSVPFISGGLVKGMSSAFNTAANYIGGALQSSASSAAQEAATGNIHLGNASWNNINANKFDTNSTMMHGMATEQLGTGVLRTGRADGDITYDASQAISRLPTTVRASELLSSSFSEQAESAKSATIQNQRAYDRSISSATTELDSLGKHLDSRKSINENFSSRESQSAAASVSNMKSTATNIAKRNHLDVNDVFKGLTTFSQSADLGVGFDKSGLKFNVKGGLNARTEHLRTNETSTQHGVSRSIDITAEEASKFSQDLHKVEEYSKTNSVDSSKSESESHLSQLSTDLRNARTVSRQYSINKAESDRLSQASSYVRQHSGQIDSDLGNEIANHTVVVEGRAKAEELFAGKERATLEKHARDYISKSGTKSSIMAAYLEHRQSIDPDKRYQAAEGGFEQKEQGINKFYKDEKRKTSVDTARDKDKWFSQGDFESGVDKVKQGQNSISKKLEKGETSLMNRYKDINSEVSKDIEVGANKAESSAFSMGNSVRPVLVEDQVDRNKDSQSRNKEKIIERGKT